jgi:hypothetical protein
MAQNIWGELVVIALKAVSVALVLFFIFFYQHSFRNVGRLETSGSIII